ncbi:MAG: YceI family protein [Saprospiraceae bacterium]
MNFPKFLLSATLILGLSVGLLSAQTFSVDTEASSVKWTASKVIGGGHNGSVSLASGKLVLENGQLSQGSFAADMTTVSVDDLTGGMADKLSGHLFSDDFFGVTENPSSSFIINSIEKTGVNVYSVTGDLTIKGQMNSVTFPAALAWDNELPTATATVAVDRTKFGIRYGSGSFFDDLGDKAIEDEFQLEIKLVGKR